ncbi:MAG: primosomal protein N' [Nitrospirae bacterium]|nr:MAG: primosomal protein N' [Nitrospirota bacterium]
MYADIAFPLKLHSLTYKIPEGASTDIEGRIVKASIGGRPALGLVVSVSAEPPVAKKKFREIEEVYGRFGSKAALPLILWLADYHVSTIGMALKTCFFEEAAALMQSGLVPSETDETQAAQGFYASMLYHAGSTKNELSLLADTVSGIKDNSKGIVALAPETVRLDQIAGALRAIFGERLCVLHGRLTKKKRMSAIERIISGDADVIAGTRSAVFAPLSNVSFISVAGEHSQSYKGEEGIRYNGRDVAVMRGFIEKSPVLLSSVCPSLESVYNSRTGKYVALNAKGFRIKGAGPMFADAVRSAVEGQQEVVRPKIEIINLQKRETISPAIIKQAKNIFSAGGRFLFLVNRQGYSLIRCDECGFMPRCGRCLVPMAFTKNNRVLRCGYCGETKPGFSVCPDCKSAKLSFFGAGTEKVKEEVERLLHAEALVIEKKHGRASAGEDMSGSSFVVGTSYARRKSKEQVFDGAAYLNIDAIVFQPDFRADEKAFQEIMELVQVIRPDSKIYLQTGDARRPLWNNLRHYDFGAFYDYELAQRKSLGYPPFSRTALLVVKSKSAVPGLQESVYSAVSSVSFPGLEILGPIERPPSGKAYRQQFHILLKAKDSRILHKASRSILGNLDGMKDVEAFADTNPYKI